MEHDNEETFCQLDLFPFEGHPEMGISGHWLDYPYAWDDLGAALLRFYAERVHQVNRPLLCSDSDSPE